MCLLVLAWQAHPRYRLIVAANRDEYHDRPAAALARWSDDAPNLIAGRDLLAGGTWLGVDERRRFGVVTNFRDLQKPQRGAPSRGALIPGYLAGDAGAQSFLQRLAAQASRYSGFNLLLMDDDSLWYASNRSESFARSLPPGIHGLSNQFLDTPWPKLVRVRQQFERELREPPTGSPQPASLAARLFAMLADREPAQDDSSLPGTMDPQMAQALSAPFVAHPTFGTRSSSVVLLEPSGALHVAERRFDANGMPSGETAFDLAADEWM